MAFYAVPTPTGQFPYWSVSTKLEGVELSLEYRWNDRAQYWTIDINLIDDTPLVTGQVLKPYKNLLARAEGEISPPGALFVYQPGNPEPLIPGLTDFGQSVILVYAEERELG